MQRKESETTDGTRQDQLVIRVSYLPRQLRDDLKPLGILQQAVARLQASSHDVPSEERLSAQIDQLCQLMIEEKARATAKQFRSEIDTLQRQLADSENKFKQLQEKMTASPTLPFNSKNLLDSVVLDASQDKESLQVLALREEIKQLRITQDIQ